MKSTFFSVQKKSSAYFKNTFSDSMYHIFLFNGNGKIIVDFIEYNFIGKTVFFTSPFQNIQILSETEIEIEVLNFHGDFYCIEFHKKEVACNGLLFNNIYLFPHFSLTEEVYQEISDYFLKIKEVNHYEDFSGSVLQSYLQLILAISSREKNKLLPDKEIIKDDFNELKLFQNLVEEHFIVEKSLSFYADLLHVTSNTLSKKIKSKFNKTPSQIIQERVILEAKKQIHLTRKSIKEIAVELNFNDEFHFSKYFKKYVGISPTQFRKETGISIVADLYK
ncbi:helix-turn-helix domain-containing protein [Chryseobacterium indoltheticum]|uniref:AraC-type DNA-binding protein n=1 Tax=Chryseobacterium indoltheticum TaxID=254 RepID=A0A381FD89_9FLAO|nr:helix-turn-helix domain-containing protein [Chryseobacterium indoltheticum]AZA74018.1 AraC family transcriptional regulator [Chryseobacterium indoltheticum]SIQ23689.1 AraC-type DNA-binding protein [Chryseobacterium indoltheticum]SUX44515.1 L-rhamnose operon regulatory protein rhaS [Chryseobacterium indoltheticum]